MKKLIISMLAAVVVVAGVSSPARADGPRDCDANAIVWCGAYSQQELINKIHTGDGHNGDIAAVYSMWGITDAQINATVNGSVTNTGAVIVNGATVATNAASVGRQFMPGSTAKGNVWLRPTSVSFGTPSIDAYVYMVNGRFAWAILKSCGNTLQAVPVAPPAPKPTPPAPKPVPPAPKPVPAPTPAPAPVPAPTPTVIPETGMELPIAAGFGTTAIAYGVRELRRSRSRLTKALRKI